MKIDPASIEIRDVIEADVQIFYEMQKDPESVALADVPARDHDAHVAHWQRILSDDNTVTKTIVTGGEVVGNLVSWVDGGERLVGYWIGRSHWGRGIASLALPRFLELLRDRPLRATVASHNKGSIRVLEKAGFVYQGEAGSILRYSLDTFPSSTS